MKKNILICDDHVLFLAGITDLLKKLGNNYNIVSFNKSTSCKNYLQQNHVDVFICDLNIDNIDGFYLIDELKIQLKNSKIIILTAYFEDFLIEKAQKMGINAFLKKETTAEELIAVIESHFNAPFYSNKIHNQPINNYNCLDKKVSNKFILSKQEREIIKLIIQGKTSKEIGSLLFISKTQLILIGVTSIENWNFRIPAR